MVLWVIIKVKNMLPDILHRTKFYSQKECLDLYAYLIQTCRFLENSNNLAMPRLIYWFGPYPYYYSEINNPACPLPEMIKEVAQDISTYLLEEGVNAQFNSVLINYYRDGKDRIGMHSDDISQLEEFPIIASLSLGDSRMFKMRHTISSEKQSYILEDGDLFIMKGNTQDEWKHGISPEQDKGARINLTFRNVVRPPK